MDNKILDILEDAILDVGYLNWWSEKLPEIFQVEFGGVQLYCEPKSVDTPASSLLALKFSKLISVNFIKKGKAETNWFKFLHDEKLEPQTISYDRFTLTNHSLVKEIIDIADQVELFYGQNLVDINIEGIKYIFGFWAGDVGIIIYADEMRIYNSQGEIPFNKIEELNNKWWNYWEKYWKLKNSEKPLPKDYACEATIPLSN